MIFFESEKICGKNWPFCYFLCAFYVIFSHIFRKNSFSQKNVPLLICGVDIFGWIFAPAILRLMNTPDEILNLAVMYARIYFLSMLSIVGFNFSSGILRALGDSRRPMIYQLLGGFANILGNTLFIYIFHFGVAGAAMATLSMYLSKSLPVPSAAQEKRLQLCASRCSTCSPFACCSYTLPCRYSIPYMMWHSSSLQLG